MPRQESTYCQAGAIHDSCEVHIQHTPPLPTAVAARILEEELPLPDARVVQADVELAKSGHVVVEGMGQLGCSPEKSSSRQKHHPSSA